MICALCGRTEDEHHAFVPIKKPSSCVCDIHTWGVDSIPPVCNHYETNGSNNDGYCIHCEHDRDCHRK